MRKKVFRTKETNFGDLMADLVKIYFNADCSVLEPELLNTDKVISAGKIKLSSISDIDTCECHARILPGSALIELLSSSN